MGAKFKGICALVPTRFGSGHMVLRDAVDSKEAVKKLSATELWRDSLSKGSASLKKVHGLLCKLQGDLFCLAGKT
jgi:hypothetical protein